MSDHDLITLHELTGSQSDNLRQLVSISAGLASLFSQMDARMTALEQEIAGATILHQDVLLLMRRIRERADTDGEKYHLTSRGIIMLRTMLKRSVASRYGIRDLHDLPKARLDDALRYIDNAPTYKLVLKVRERIG